MKVIIHYSYFHYIHYKVSYTIFFLPAPLTEIWLK